MKLNADQKSAVAALGKFTESPHPEFGLYGPAGTGKSTVLASWAHSPVGARTRILYTAPTHKAKGVLADMLVAQGFSSADVRTVHAALTMHKPKGSADFIQSADWQHTSPMKHYDVMVIDECSMIDSRLFSILQKTAQHFGTKLIYTGDACQLPPVKEEHLNGGKSLTFNLPDAQTATLTQIVRHEGDILSLATRARRNIGGAGKVQFANTEHVIRERDWKQFFRRAAAQTGQTKILAWTNDRVQYANMVMHRKIHGRAMPAFFSGQTLYAAEPTDDWASQQRFTILEATPTTQLGYPAWSVHAAPSGEFWGGEGVAGPGQFHVHLLDYPAWKEVDELMRTRAKFARALGGALRGLKRTDPNYARLDQQRRDAWQEFFAFKKTFPELRRAHAMTVHGAQGSTFENVFVWQEDIFKSSDVSLRGKLVYVAYSRASHKLVVC